MNKFFATLAGALFFGNAFAADITVYYSPTCPHCHHAREFIAQNLIYEYPDIKVTEVNVVEAANRSEFMEVLKKCEYESGGVPVLVIGEKCFQGYADFMADDLRKAVEADLDDAAKKVAAENKKALETDADAFREEHSDRASAVTERNLSQPVTSAKENTPTEKSNTGWVFYLVLGILVIGLGFVLTRKCKK